MQNFRIVLNVDEATKIAKAATEGACALPFGVFGRTGGGGIHRWELVRAINNNSWFEARQLFTTLINESLDEMITGDPDGNTPVRPETALELFKYYLFEHEPKWLAVEVNLGWTKA